jgi:hypothetical protein
MPILCSVLRIFGPAFDVEAFLRAHHLSPTSAWKIGEARIGGGKNQDSGLSVAMDDRPDWLEDIPHLRVGGMTLEALLTDARLGGASAWLDIALPVGGDSYTSSIAFSPSQVIALAQLGLTLSISAYPVSD